VPDKALIVQELRAISQDPLPRLVIGRAVAGRATAVRLAEGRLEADAVSVSVLPAVCRVAVVQRAAGPRQPDWVIKSAAGFQRMNDPEAHQP
jgi:hypothetical protein